MAELPIELWAIIARKLLPKTPLAPVSRRLYASTATAMANASYEHKVEDRGLDIYVTTTGISCCIQKIYNKTCYDVNVYDGTGRKRMEFDMRSRDFLQQKSPGVYKSARGGVHSLAAARMRAAANVIPPLWLNYTLSKVVAGVGCNYDWIESYADNVRATAARFGAGR